MGMGHMKQVWALWGELPDRPFRALLYIAMRLPDADPAPQWFGAPDEIAVAIGMGAEVDGPRRKTVLNKVGLAMTALVDAGALALVQRAAPGRRPVYELLASMQRTRYTRDRSNNGRRLNGPDETVPTVPTKPGALNDPHCLTALRTEIGEELGRAGARDARAPARRLRAIDGGRASNDPDVSPVQLPLLAAVPAPDPEPVTHQRIQDVI